MAWVKVWVPGSKRSPAKAKRGGKRKKRYAARRKTTRRKRSKRTGRFLKR